MTPKRLTRSSRAMLFIGLSFLSLFASYTHAFWILGHPPLNFDARLDPIVNPGNVSGHTHSFVGSNAITSTSDYDSVRSSSACTTSAVGADKSVYWTPTLYQYSKAKDTFTAFKLAYVNTYYLQRGNMKLHAFPAGLKMLAGTTTLRQPAATKQLQSAVSFVCLNYKDGSSQTSTLPTGVCPQGVRAQIVFPSCWDGKNLDSADHKSHMSYPIGDNADNGDACPSTHPIRFVTLFYEFVWATGEGNANGGTWVFANGDTTGFGFHGDFLNGWDVDVLQAAIDKCTGDLFNNIEGCAPFGPTLDRNMAKNCHVDPSKVTGLLLEDVAGPLKKLPGCNPITTGALQGKGACTPSSSSTSSSGSSSGSSAPPTTTTSTASTGFTTTTTTANRAASKTPLSAAQESAIAKAKAKKAKAKKAKAKAKAAKEKAAAKEKKKAKSKSKNHHTKNRTSSRSGSKKSSLRRHRHRIDHSDCQ